MLKKIPFPDDDIACSHEGHLMGEGSRGYPNIIEGTLKQHTHIGVYVEISNLSDVTTNTVIVVASATAALFRYLSRLSRCTLVSDHESPQALVSFCRQNVPALRLRVFPAAQQEKAMESAYRVPQESPLAGSKIRLIPSGRDDVIAFEVDGVPSSDEPPRSPTGHKRGCRSFGILASGVRDSTRFNSPVLEWAIQLVRLD